MRPIRYPYSKQKELAKPAPSDNPLKLYDQFLMSVLFLAKPDNPDHARLVNELMRTYSQLHS